MELLTKHLTSFPGLGYLMTNDTYFSGGKIEAYERGTALVLALRVQYPV